MAQVHRYTQKSRRSSTQTFNELMFDAIQKELEEAKLVPTKLITSLVHLSSPSPYSSKFSHLYSQSARKRKTSSSQSSLNRKRTSARTLELFSESKKSSELFRCYSEEKIVSDEPVRNNIIESLMDDDCATDEEQVRLAVKKVKKQIMKAL